MIVNIRMADGRTTYQFASRGDLRAVLGHEPDQADRVQRCWVRWNLDDTDWREVRLVYLRKHSIAFVVAAEDEARPFTDDLPAKAVADERKRKWEARQAEVQAA